MPNQEEETRKDVSEREVTKVHGQPTNQDLDLLEDELLRIASSFYSELGGGAHGHAGLLLSDVDYAAMAPGTPFVVPPNPGVYPAGAIPAAQRAQREAEHKALIKQFQTCVGVAKGLKELILQAIDEDFVLELRAEQTGYLNVTPQQMMTHLRARWGALDFVDINMLMAECDSTWSPAEVPTKYFNRIDKARRQLARANVQIDERAMMLKALKCFRDAGDYDAPIQEWEARPPAAQTYPNLKTMMSLEYSKLNRQDATTARATGHASANAVEEFAQATEELVAELTEKHSKQIETLIKANNEAMTKNNETIAKLTAALLEIKSQTPSRAPTTTPAAATQGTTKAQRWAEKCRTATTCPHCNKIHPNRTHDQCWHLEKNAAKRPAGWTASSTRST
jgi:hypothetical protein